MRLAFLGTPDFAVSALSAIVAAGHEVACVYSQPPAPRGRGQELKPSPVQAFAEAQGIPVRTPISMRDPAEITAFAALNLDAAVVVAFGQILPGSVLEAPRLGSYNVHASLLPRWRGAAPIQRAIQAGDAETGVCLMQMEKGLDSGPVLLQAKLSIGDSETGGQLHDRLSELGAEVLGDGLGLARAELFPRPWIQPEAGVTYAHKLDKAEARLDWSHSATALANKVRAFNPWPMADALIAGERVRIHGAIALPLEHRAEPGTVLLAGRDGIDIACGVGALRVRVLQRDGGKAITAADYLNGRRDLIAARGA